LDGRLVALSVGALANALNSTGAAIWNFYAANPVYGPFYATKKAAPYFELATDLFVALGNYTTLGDFLSTVLDRVREHKKEIDPDLIDDKIREIAWAILKPQTNDSLRRGLSHEILDTHNYALDGCVSENCNEFCFDAASGAYIEFIDQVLQKAKSVGPLIGYVALRFLRETQGTLGMQRFPLTVAIETAISRPGTLTPSL
jgi:hypothetical protein